MGLQKNIPEETVEIKMFVMLNHRNSMYLPKQNEVIVQNVKNILKSDNLSPSYNSGMTKENLKKKIKWEPPFINSHNNVKFG